MTTDIHQNSYTCCQLTTTTHMYIMCWSVSLCIW